MGRWLKQIYKCNHAIHICYILYVVSLAIGPGMMMYDDFTNEDFGNIIMDAEDRESVPLSDNNNVASFRSIQPQTMTRRKRRNKNRRVRSKSKFKTPRRRPGNTV